MGCIISSAVSSLPEVPEGWVDIVINTETGDISSSRFDYPADTIAKYTLQRQPEISGVKHHFVKQKIGGSWTETKLGGVVKFEVLEKKQLVDSWKQNLKDGSMPAITADTKDNSLKKPLKAISSDWDISGVATWTKCEDGVDKTYYMTGQLGDDINIVHKETGQVVLIMWSKKFGKQLKFYNRLIKHGMCPNEADWEVRDKHYCGTRKQVNLYTDDKIYLSLTPEILEKLPVALFAMAVMYSDQNFGEKDMG